MASVQQDYSAISENEDPESQVQMKVLNPSSEESKDLSSPISKPSRVLQIGNKEEILEHLMRLKSLYRSVNVTIKFRNLSFWTMVSKPVIPTVGSTLKKPITGYFEPKYRFDILKDLNGRFSPSRMTLILGPPGSGRSVFMKALSGKLQTRSAKLEGEITYNEDNIKSGDFLIGKVADYVEQLDSHAPTLTVEETIKYAWMSTTGGHHHYALAEDLAAVEELKKDDEHLTAVQNIITLLGLKGCKDTYVGDNQIRGISGGQKRRVTVGEMMVLPRPVKFMDDISNGLDAATAFDILQSFKDMCSILGHTYIISLLQPAPEIYNLFDEILLLSEGHIIYHGPREEILPYFESLGYYCPEHVDEADFLQELATSEGKKYIKKEFLEKAPQGSEEISKEWKKSTLYTKMLNEMNQEANFQNSSVEKLEAGTSKENKSVFKWPHEYKEYFPGTFWYHFYLTLHRQYLITIRDAPYLKAKVGQSLIVGTLAGSLFSNIGLKEIGTLRGFLYYIMLNGNLNNFSMLPMVYKQKEVFKKQSDALFFPSLAFVLAQSIINLPIQLLESVLICSIVYWSAGLAEDLHSSRFFYFLMMYFAMCVSTSQFFRLISFIMPSFYLANPTAGVFNMLVVLFSGYIQPANQISDGWIGFYYVNPLGWSLQAVTINELQAPKYNFLQCLNVDCTETERYGDYILKQYGYSTDQKYMWHALAVLIGEYLLFLIFSAIVVTYIHPDTSPRMVVAIDDAPVPLEKIDLEGAAEQSAELPFSPITFAFRDISYTVPLPSGETIKLLDSVNGFFESGSVIALMGSSGAGKTTLLDVLAGRKNTGKITGDIFVNGVPKNENHFRKIMGYVEQFDTLTDKATARENIEFSAALRLSSSVDSKQRTLWVDKIIELLELVDLQNTMVGQIESGGMSFEQRKRISIGIELAANPSILFLDEPTTGLDSRAAQIIIRNIRSIAASGRTIVCTIHQPSTPIFFSFDRLLLLQRGGKIVYFGDLGENCNKLIDYLEEVPSVDPILSHKNPAVWMLEVIGAGVSNVANETDFNTYYNDSPLNAINMNTLNSIIKNPNDPDYQSIRDSMKMDDIPVKGYTASYWTQFVWLSKRIFTVYWRFPVYNAARFMLMLIIALIFASAYPDIKYHNAVETISVAGVIYVTTLFCGINHMFAGAPLIFSERPVFYREQQSNMYSPAVYTIVMTLVEIPYLIICSFLFVIPFFYIVGLNNPGNETEKFWWYYFYHFIFSLCLTYLGQFFSALTSTDQAAQVLCALSSTTISLFAGFIITEKNFVDFWLFMYWLNPMHYALEGLFSTQFHNDNTIITVGTYQTTAEKFIHSFYSTWKYSHIGYDVLAILLLTLFVRVGFYLCLKYLHHQKR